MRNKIIRTFGPGGYDPSKPNNNLLSESVVDVIPTPLDVPGAIATLLAVTGTVSVEDAANAVGLTPQNLIDEANAWAAAQEMNQ